MTATDPVQAVMKVLNDEGCAPGHGIHSWRCEWPQPDPEPCTCVEELAAEVVAAARPAIEREAKAEAWDEGHDAGHQAARAINPEWPEQPTNPYREADQ